MYEKNGTKYTVRVLDETGKAVGAGEKVTFNINGVFYTRTTDANGYAALNINLNPGNYIITAMYGDSTVANNSCWRKNNIQHKWCIIQPPN